MLSKSNIHQLLGRFAPLRTYLDAIAELRVRNDQLRAFGEELRHERRLNLALQSKLASGSDVAIPASDAIPQTRSIVFNALPKSASTYCYETLRRRYGLAETGITAGYFPHDMILWERYFRFVASGGCIAHHHIDASPANLFFLRRRPAVLIVHLRDPRQAVLSWAHHLRRSNARTMEPHTVLALPSSWWDQDLSSQLDKLVDEHLPVFVQWIEGWVTASDSGRADVVFTQFERMVADPEGFFSELAGHCGLDRNAVLEPPDPTQDGASHFRAGKIDEWRSVFSQSQIDRANAVVPDALLARFGWNR